MKIAVFLCGIFFVVGCSHVHSCDTRDPYQNWNHTVSRLNDALDARVMRPVAVLYHQIVPRPVQRGVGNFFSNLSEPVVMLNDLLQGHPRRASISFLRFLLNSTLGLAGFFDWSGSFKIPAHTNDFGMTFALLNASHNPQHHSSYVMLPLLGPSTIRDLFGLIVAAFLNPFLYVHPQLWLYGTFSIHYLNTRAELLSVDHLLSATFDPYIATREAFLQNRSEQFEAHNLLKQKRASEPEVRDTFSF